MAKAKRETDRLNVALSGVDAAAKLIERIAGDLPECAAKHQIITAAGQVSFDVDVGLDAMRIIKNAVENI
ncbi:MAG: hypothetical protein NTX56_04050 [Proteobacteria bacterium]|nr:hypothetical protein [Pseudomonadota bacterium]